MVTLGILLCTFKTEDASSLLHPVSLPTKSGFYLGLACLSAAVLTGCYLSILQGDTYKRYKMVSWQEYTFYTHALSLPGFLLLYPKIRDGIAQVNASPKTTVLNGFPFSLQIPSLWLSLGLHCLTQ